MSDLKDLFAKIDDRSLRIGIVGLGYVGLPLACLFSNRFRVFGFDISGTRVRELTEGTDRTKEVSDSSQILNENLSFSTDIENLADSDILIVAVPTPIDRHKKPNLEALQTASELVSTIVRKNQIVVFESTVYPGVTEDFCGKIISAKSGLTLNENFFLGYSPERVNPGDKEHTIDKIVKVVSGSNKIATEILDKVYGSVITAGTHVANSIKIAEAAKVIENTQRDLNIALMNELAIIFDRLDIDTNEVLEAAGTKWNFQKFKPGLVGGHCIGVDPYYLTYCAEGLGLHPEVILSGRRINDSMGSFVAHKTLSLIMQNMKNFRNPTIGILGVTFKENIPDLRHTKVLSMMREIENSGISTFICDPLADPNEVEREFGKKLTNFEDLPLCDGIIIAVPHKQFFNGMDLDSIASKLTETRVVIDIKGVLNRNDANQKGLNLWRL